MQQKEMTFTPIKLALFVIVDSIDDAILQIFFDKLNKHIAFSKQMSENYLNTLLYIKHYLKIMINYRYNVEITDNKIYCLDLLSDKVIEEIKAFSDDEYNNDVIYALGMIYHLLLSSIIKYRHESKNKLLSEDDSLEQNHTIAKSLINMAFIV